MPSGIVGACDDERDEAGPLARPQGTEVAPVDGQLAAPAGQTGDVAQERGLAGAVGPHHRHPLAVVDVEVDAAQHGLAAELDPGADEVDHRFAFRRTRTKNGAPRNAVTTPMGISAGAATVRAMRSVRTRNAPPNSSDSGRMMR